MHRFRLPSLSCGHCVYAVTKAVKGVDPTADIEFDLPKRRAAVHSRQSAERFAAAIAAAGYEVEQIA